jgi:prevent-host-death family protein
VAATFNIHYAKTHLSKLLEQVQAGEEIIIAKSGKPIARLCPVEKAAEKTKPKRVIGSLKGKFEVPDDFDDPMPEFEDAFYHGPVFPEPE